MRQTTLLLCLALALSSCNEIIDNTPPDLQTLRESRTVGNTKDLDVHLVYDVGSLDVRSMKGGELFSVNLEYDAHRTRPRFDFREGEHAMLDLKLDHQSRLSNSRRTNDLTLKLNEAVPIRMLDFIAGVSDAHMDLSGLQIGQFQLKGGVGKIEVAFDRPVEEPMSRLEVQSGVGNLTIRGLGNVRVQNLKVDGGVGRTDLDFTGDLKDSRTDTEINVGVGQVRLLLPREAGVTIEAEGSFLSNISAPSFEKNGKTYTHKGPDGSSTRIHIRVRSGVGGVTVELI